MIVNPERSLLLFILFCVAVERTGARLNVELQFTRKPQGCVSLPCPIDFCIRYSRSHNCSTGTRIEFEGSEGPPVVIPFNGPNNNLTLTLDIVTDVNFEQPQNKEPRAAWFGRLKKKEWQSMSYALVRLKCSDNYYGPSCGIHCTPKNKNQECDEETGRRKCVNGFREPDCTEPFECSLRCSKNGQCSASGDCVCMPGYEGKDCSIRSSTCNAFKPCYNGGTCINLKHGNYECRCPAGFDGPQCERRVVTCADNPCKNDAECQQDFGHPLECKCKPNYHGQYCQVFARNCSSLPCQNGAICATIDDTFGCICRTGFVGHICDQKQQKCTTNTCAHGGTCVESLDRISGVECKCKSGYFGSFCEMVLVDCRTSPCMNNGVCKANRSTYQCQCKEGFTGSSCEVQIKVMMLSFGGSFFGWFILLLIFMLLFSLSTIGAIWLVNSRQRRLTLHCLHTLLSNSWFQRPQPPRVKPPPTPVNHSSADLFLKTLDNITLKEKQASVIQNSNENLYIDEPITTSTEDIPYAGSPENKTICSKALLGVAAIRKPEHTSILMDRDDGGRYAELLQK